MDSETDLDDTVGESEEEEVLQQARRITAARPGPAAQISVSSIEESRDESEA